MNLHKDFPNMKLDCLKAHPSLDIFAAVGFRSCIILSPDLEIIQRHLDSNRDEKFYCCEFADVISSDAQNEACRRCDDCAFASPAGGAASTCSTDSPDTRTREDIASGMKQNAHIKKDSSENIMEDSGETQSTRDTEDPSKRRRRKRNLLCLGGESGIIKILDLGVGLLDGFLRGHTGAVYDMLSCGNILITSSEDSTVRLWSLENYECLGVLGGMFGHKDHVLSIDLSYGKDLLVSVGTDSAIKQWQIDIEALSARCPRAGEYHEQAGSKDAKPCRICADEHIRHAAVQDPHCVPSDYLFLQKPQQNFVNVHKSTITKVRYYGDLILSLCNSIISAIYNNKNLEELCQGSNFELSKDHPIFMGSIDLYGNCKTFTVVKHMLVGISTGGDIYFFDLRDIGVEKTPFIIESKLPAAEDFAIVDDYIYITTGKSIHKLKFDTSRFNEKEE